MQTYIVIKNSNLNTENCSLGRGCLLPVGAVVQAGWARLRQLRRFHARVTLWNYSHRQRCHFCVLQDSSGLLAGGVTQGEARRLSLRG
jgi:hypothetical protein